MLVFSAFHIHDEYGNADNECYQCANHLPHDGHYSQSSQVIDDCLMCQLISVPYLAVKTIPQLQPVISGSKLLIEPASCLLCRLYETVSLRAPPFILS